MSDRLTSPLTGIEPITDGPRKDDHVSQCEVWVKKKGQAIDDSHSQEA